MKSAPTAAGVTRLLTQGPPRFRSPAVTRGEAGQRDGPADFSPRGIPSPVTGTAGVGDGGTIPPPCLFRPPFAVDEVQSPRPSPYAPGSRARPFSLPGRGTDLPSLAGNQSPLPRARRHQCPQGATTRLRGTKAASPGPIAKPLDHAVGLAMSSFSPRAQQCVHQNHRRSRSDTPTVRCRNKVSTAFRIIGRATIRGLRSRAIFARYPCFDGSQSSLA